MLIIFRHVPHGWAHGFGPRTHSTQFFPFLAPEAPNNKEWVLSVSPAVWHIGSTSLLTALKCLRELMECFRALDVCSQIRSVHVKFPAELLLQGWYSGKFIYIKESNHCLYCLFRAVCIQLCMHHLPPRWKALKIWTKYFHFSKNATCNHRRQQHVLTWSRTAKQLRRSVLWHYLSHTFSRCTFFSHRPHKHEVEPFLSAMMWNWSVVGVLTSYQCYTLNQNCFSSTAVWPDCKNLLTPACQIWSEMASQKVRRNMSLSVMFLIFFGCFYKQHHKKISPVGVFSFFILSRKKNSANAYFTFF